MPLTDTQVRNAKPAKKPFKLSDGGWLFLIVNPSGSKLWRMAYRFHGAEKTLSFGGYPEISLKDARARRDEAKALVASGIDPSQQRKLDKLSRAVTMATTFGAPFFSSLSTGGAIPEAWMKLRGWRLHRPVGAFGCRGLAASLLKGRDRPGAGRTGSTSAMRSRSRSRAAGRRAPR